MLASGVRATDRGAAIFADTGTRWPLVYMH
jgi:hypothetical protein